MDRVTEGIDRLGRRTLIGYDALDRLTSAVYQDATVTYSYDAASRPTRIDDTQSASVSWNYDAADRVLSETTAAGVVSYAYNAASQLTQMTAADRAAVNYGYDSAGRLRSIGQGSETFTYSYDEISRLTALQRPNGVSTVYGYDRTNRLVNLLHRDAQSQTLEGYQYSYNADGEIASITAQNSQPLLPQVKSASAADANNRIAQLGTATYSFDNLGQTTTKSDASGATTYNWDARGRMTSATLPNGQAVSYGYDALGRRASRTANGATTNFLYDGADVVLDRASDGATVDYLNGAGIDDKLRQTSSSAPSSPQYFLQDHLGSTSALTDATGGVIERQQYEPFGATTGSSLTRYGYTGRESDEATGLMYYRARWYDPQQARFITEDPIGFASGDANFYSYVGNNPINATDPTGLEQFTYYYDGKTFGTINPQTGRPMNWPGDGPPSSAVAAEPTPASEPTPAPTPRQPKCGCENQVLVQFNLRNGSGDGVPIAPYINHSVAKDFQAALNEINAAVPGGVAFTEVYRTKERQTQLWNAYQDRKRRGIPGNPAAQPGTSRHEAGFAVDIKGMGTISNPTPLAKTVIPIMEKHGFIWGRAYNDPPHFQSDFRKGGYKSGVDANKIAAAYYKLCIQE